MIQLQEQYSDEEECRQAVAEYNKDKKPEDEMRYCSYLNSITGKRMYVPCTKEYFFTWRNMLAEEKRKEIESKACHIISDRYKNTFVTCRHYGRDCECRENCPYIHKTRYAANGMTFLPDQEVVKGGYLSLDRAFEEYELEPAEEDSPFHSEQDPLINLMHDLIEELQPEDKIIIELYLDNKKDREIAVILNKPKTTVTTRRERIVEILKEKISKIL